MTSFRRAIPDFQLANPIYVGAQVYFYGVDADGVSTGNFATIYAAPRGTQKAINPQVLDGDGKFERPVYIEEPVTMTVISATVGSHNTGVILPVGLWKGQWTTLTTYVTNDFVIDGDTEFPNVYAASNVFTSAATIAEDIDAGNLVLVLDGSVFVAIRDVYAAFGAVYLGAKTVLPIVDNDGNALINGALIFYTPTSVFRAYDLATTTWVSPSLLSHSHPQSDIDDLVDDLAAINTELDTKFDKAGGTITGATGFDIRPTFDGATPWDNGNYAPFEHGCVRLERASGWVGDVVIQLCNGNRIIIDGVSRTLTSSITIPYTDFAITALRYVYVTWTGTAVSYIVNANVPVLAANGVMVDSTNAARTLVGAIYREAAGGINDSVTKRHVLSWFNRKDKLISLTTVGSSATAPYAAVGAEATFIAWRDEAIQFTMTAYATQNATDAVRAAIFLNGTQVGHMAAANCLAGQTQALPAQAFLVPTSEALNTLRGATGSTGTGTSTLNALTLATIKG